MRNTVNMEIEDLKAAARALMERIQGFNDGCDCCASINAEDTNEYATLEVALSALEEAQEELRDCK